MNQWLQQLQTVLAKKEGDRKASGLGDLLGPGALGGLAGLLAGSKSSRKLLTKFGGKALLLGGGAAAGALLWNKYKDRIRTVYQPASGTGGQQTPPDQRAERLITALVFAAKSDGHIDEAEQAAIEKNIQQAGYGEQAERVIKQAIARPLDPQWLAAGVKNEEEALELYVLSCAAIDVDHFMERSYLAALGDALAIPQDVRDGVQRDIAAESAG
ncbi:tellurite resistance TerB family protein [Pantoea eucrina]|uniref:tellurite resistance TerB family protein n=1 Tax=Pantoea eucrina TaxID=472693 RepID=UPI00080F5257|nr:DUF533 domain-containing protein [Pantoea eucrina]